MFAAQMSDSTPLLHAAMGGGAWPSGETKKAVAI